MVARLALTRCLLLCLLLSVSLGAETISIEFSPAEQDRVLEGNLVVLISNKKFSPSGPGLLNVYLSRLETVKNLRWQKGEVLRVDVGELSPDQEWYISALFDENQNFMWRGYPDAGEYYSERLDWNSQGSARIVLKNVKREKPKRELDWLTEHAILSPRLREAGFSREESTLRYLVGLPPNYWKKDQRYPVAFIAHGFNGERWTYLKNFKRWRKQMAGEPMILVSLDCYGPYGHHVFLNSGGNGPRLDVLTKELVPEIDRLFRTNGRRVIYGHSSGGWTAISVLRRASDVFVGVVATGPDPLTFPSWWMAKNKNLYRNPDGSKRCVAPTIGLDMETFVDAERKTGSFGQYTAFMAAFSEYRPERVGMPFASPFDLDTGELDEDVWEQWKENDMDLWVKSHPNQAKKVFEDRLVLIVGKRDEFGLYETTKHFHKTLESLSIAHKYREIEDGGHTNYLERPEFAKELWSSLYRLATRRSIPQLKS